ncbi:hypothetical protein D3C71_221410 [compost metagenome]
MDDFLKVFGLLKEYLGPTLAVGAAAGWYLFRQRNADAVNTANAEGTVGAINSWKEIAAQNAKRADDERTARLAAEARADEIAKERNAALQQVWVLTGQVEILTKQLAELQKKVAAMEGNGNAKQ